MHISKLEATQEDEYSRWLGRVPGSLVYYSRSFHRFLEAITEAECTVLIARRQGSIVGALPYFRKHADQGTVINSQPWYGSHGGCVVADDCNAARVPLVEAYRDVAAGLGIISATLVLSPDEEAHRAEYESIIGAAAVDHRIGQISPLPAVGADLEGRLEGVLTQKTRNLARKARKQGFREVVTDESWAWRFLHEVHVQNMSAIGGTAKPLEHFEALRLHLPTSMRRLSVAMLDEEPVAALLLILFNQTVEYITPVVRVEHRSRQPLSFLIWEGMLRACQEGCRQWNWGGTWPSQTSLHHFKAGWGAVDRPYSYLVSATPQRVSWLRTHLTEVLNAFPYFYVYPKTALDDDHT